MLNHLLMQSVENKQQNLKVQGTVNVDILPQNGFFYTK